MRGIWPIGTGKHFLIWLACALVFMLAMDCAPAQAQVTSYETGGFTIHSGSVDGQKVRGTSYQVKNFTYTDLRVGQDEKHRITSYKTQNFIISKTNETNPLIPTAEEPVLETGQSGFESLRGYQQCGRVGRVASSGS